MTSAGTPLRRSARPGWYGSGCPTRARAGPSVLASWTAPPASASHSRGLASDEDRAGTCRLTRTLAPGILSLARLSMPFRISAERETVILVSCGQRSDSVITTIKSETAPVAVTVMPTAGTVLMANAGAVSDTRGTVSVISAQTDTIVDTVRVGRAPDAIAATLAAPGNPQQGHLQRRNRGTDAGRSTGWSRSSRRWTSSSPR
jgi:hypothetical protein